jgi:uncharacterized protein (DUF427 family)
LPVQGRRRAVRGAAGRRHDVADGAWSYQRPYDEHAALADRVAFWSEKFENIEFKAVP